MKLFLASIFSLLGCWTIFAQTSSRVEKLAQIKELDSRIERIVDDLCSPSPDDARDAEAQGVSSTRLNPRETYGWIMAPQGGGAYFSFTTGSHDYQKTAELELDNDYLSSGFSGADYGFIGDLGDIPLSSVDKDSPGVAYVLKYEPVHTVRDARDEYSRSREFKIVDTLFRNNTKVMIGHTYVLRAVSFDRADIAVLFRVVRKDSDGSVTIFWRTLAEFPKPKLEPPVKES